MKTKRGVLLLSHCGYSFMEDLTAMVQALGWESYILSSQPIEQAKTRLQQLRKLTPFVTTTQSQTLSWEAIEDFITQCRTNNIQLIACISVWEGYREWMAKANALLGAYDITPREATLLRDKYALRQTLRDHQLSQVSTHLLTKEMINGLQKSDQSYFVKPRIGIASYGAFKLDKNIIWQDIEILKNKISLDAEYKSIFSNSVEFIAEDYIPGKEYSFEIIALNQKIYTIGIHEKIDLREHKNTVLEAACVSPPLSLTALQIQQAQHWIEKIFAALSLETGCYHLEAKYHERWEVIEINPRVGGAFVAQSIEAQTGHHLLSLWLQTLTVKHNTLASLHTKFFNLSTLEERDKTFFRVYFAERPGTIKDIYINKNITPPLIQKTFIEPGQIIQDHAREIFAAQALWKIKSSHEMDLLKIIQESNQLIEIEYA